VPANRTVIRPRRPQPEAEAQLPAVEQLPAAALPLVVEGLQDVGPLPLSQPPTPTRQQMTSSPASSGAEAVG
jgi:hypothetical protein